MAQRKFKISLLNTQFPMLSEQLSRTVVGSTEKETYTMENHPRVYYAHNVMPSDYGLDSVGYTQMVSAISPPVVANLVATKVIYGNAKRRIDLAFDVQGRMFSLLPGTVAWITLPATFPVTAYPNFDIRSITIGTVNGISYIYHRNIGAFIYNESTNSLDYVILTGTSGSDVIGVISSSGYLIAYSEDAIAWSSTLDPTDFTPSQVTGAGGGNVADIGGRIMFATANSLGVIIFTTTNAIAVTYTGNLRYPFKFREIDGSKGGLTLDKVAYEANTSAQFVYSKAGLQLFSEQKAEPLLPEVTDFLAGKRFEDFDETTSTFSVTDLTTKMHKKIKLIASRYLVISYGILEFTHALVYDIILDKLGKLKVTHADCFEFIGTQLEVSKESLAFLSYQGVITVVDFSTSAASNGVCLLGKLQYTHSKMITLQEVESENIEESATCKVSSLASLDGKNTTKVEGTEAYKAANIRKHVFHTTALNHSILYEGKFNLTTVLVSYNLAGRR